MYADDTALVVAHKDFYLAESLISSDYNILSINLNTAATTTTYLSSLGFVIISEVTYKLFHSPVYFSEIIFSEWNKD
ncbi:hypothetical protein J6590_106990 [Homalodisca vitripennis]|nr:hypothetical protein J6590_106990 [Homalodisca vitripennis]